MPGSEGEIEEVAGMRTPATMEGIVLGGDADFIAPRQAVHVSDVLLAPCDLQFQAVRCDLACAINLFRNALLTGRCLGQVRRGARKDTGIGSTTPRGDRSGLCEPAQRFQLTLPWCPSRAGQCGECLTGRASRIRP